MSVPTRVMLNVPFGGDFTGSTNYVLTNRGATVREFLAAPEGMITNSTMTLLTGFTPNANSTSQTLTLGKLDLDPNSGSSFTLAIHPNGVGSNNATEKTYRSRQSNNTGGMESLGLSNTTYGVDRQVYQFSTTTLGSDDLSLGGVVQANVSGSTAQITGASVPVPEDMTYASISGFTGATSLPMPPGTNAGYWPVVLEFQPNLLNYDTFTIKSGSKAPGDGVLKTLSGDDVVFTGSSLVDSSGNFVSDFSVTPTLYQITEVFETDSIVLSAGSRIPEGLSVYLGDYVVPTGSGTLFDLTVTTNYAQYSYASYPKYTIPLPRGTTVGVPVTIFDGYVVPGGVTVPIDSFTSDLPTSTIYDSPAAYGLVLPDIRTGKDFTLPPLTELRDVVLIDENFTIPSGSTSTLFQPIYPGFNSTTDLQLDGVQFPVGSALESELTVGHQFQIFDPSGIIAGTDSVIPAGTILPIGSGSLEGATSTTSTTISVGSLVNSRVDINTPFTVETNNGSGAGFLDTGMVLKSPFHFWAGTQVTEGNTLPSLLKVTQSMGVTLRDQMVLNTGTHFGPSTMLYSDVGFNPQGVIPALSTLNGDFTLPPGTIIPPGFSAGFRFPVPDSTVFPVGAVLPAGTSFDQVRLPVITNILSQVSSTPEFGQFTGAMFQFGVSSGLYLVFRAGTSFTPGMKFPVGTIMSEQSSAGTTITYAAATSGGSYNTPYSLAPGSYNLDNDDDTGGQAEFVFTPGQPTTSFAKLISDTAFPTDLCIPFANFDINCLKFVFLNTAFSLVNDLTLTVAYTVHGSNNVIWPNDYPLSTQFIVTSPISFTATNTVISKAITFNVQTTDEFINGVLTSPASWIKYPASGYVLTSPVRLGVNQPIAATGSNATKSYIELSPGTVLSLFSGVDPSPVLGYVSLIVSMNVTSNFTVGAPMTYYPEFRLENGITILDGQTTPGNLVIPAGLPLPGNMTLSQEVTLTAPVVLKAPYTLIKFANVASGAILARGTVFPDGANFVGQLSMSPVLSLSTPNVFNIFENQPLTSDMKFPYLYDSSAGGVRVPKFDFRQVLVNITDLENSVAASSFIIASLQQQVSDLQQQIANP